MPPRIRLLYRRSRLAEGICMELLKGVAPSWAALRGRPPSEGSSKLVVIAGLEPALGTNQVRQVYKTCGATLHYMTMVPKVGVEPTEPNF